ncbi:MAG: hypothetical protein OEU46_21975 [Alphaproteobacteria bacterium]|nr:hypothetical protein [Alphaproteobacteria bacterium]
MTLICAFGGIAGLSHSAAAMEKVHRGVTLEAIEAQASEAVNAGIVSQSEGLDRMSSALDLIYSKSKRNAAKIEGLKYNGRVRLVYAPNKVQDGTRLNSGTTAYYAPDFQTQGSDTHSERFVVVIRHMGLNWSTAELAGVIVHELSGHARQDLMNRIAGSEVNDLECEASLHEESAYQDLAVEKTSRRMVKFRQILENRFCANFRAYMKRTSPEQMKLWDMVNLDVKALLKNFRAYRNAPKSQLSEQDVSLNLR